MQSQELNFSVRVPVPMKLLAEAERFARLEVITDVKKASTDSARVTYYAIDSKSEETTVSYHLKYFLQKPIQELTYNSQVHVSVNEKIFFKDNTLIGSYSLPGFSAVSVFMKRVVSETNVPSDNDLNVLAEKLPIFESLQDKIDAKLRSILGVTSLQTWTNEYRGPITNLNFTYIVNSSYDQANFYVFHAAQYSIRTYLIYFYKTLVLFASKLGNQTLSKRIVEKLKSLNSLREKTQKKTSPNDYLSLQPIADFNLLKSRTNFQSGIAMLQQVYLDSVKVSVPATRVIKEGELLKRGEGPFDFNWNSRYFILDPMYLIYYKVGDLEEPRGKFPISMATIGEIEPFDGRDHTLKIEWLNETRCIYISSDSLQTLIDWKQQLLKTSLRVFDPSDLDFYISKIESKNIPENISMELEPINLKISLQKADSFHESGAEFLKQQTIQSIIFSELGSEQDSWEFYKVKNRVKLYTLPSQFEIHNPKSKIEKQIKAYLPIFFFLILAVFMAWLKPKVWIAAVVLGVAGLVVAFLVFKRKKKQRTSPFLFLRGQYFFKKPLKTILDYTLNLKNLNNWNQAFQSVTIKSSNKFEAQLSKNHNLFGIVHGDIKFSKNAFMISTKNLEGTYVVTDYYILEEIPSLPDCCMMTCTVKILAKNKELTDKQTIKNFQNQFYSLIKLNEAVEIPASQAKISRIADNIHPDEIGAFFVRGKPYLESIPENFDGSVQNVRKLLQNPTSEQQNMGEIPALIPTQASGDNSNDETNLEFKKGLFLRYLDYFASGKTDLFRRMVYPVSKADTRCLFSQIASIWSFLPVYLSMAADSQSPMDRLKYVFCFALAGLTKVKVDMQVPNLPYLGETYQAFFSDGSSVDFEQIDENKSSFFVQDVKKRFYIHGKFSFRLSFWDNYIGIEFLGDVFVEFGKHTPTKKAEGPRRDSMSMSLELTPSKKDSLKWIGETVELLTPTNETLVIRYPKINVSGLVVANFDVTLAGGIYVEYKSKNLYAYAEFERLDEPDLIRQRVEGKVRQLSDNKVVSVIGGLFPCFISFDNFCFWKSELVSSAKLISGNRLLPSDGSLREDLYNLEKGKSSTSRFMRIQVAIKNQLMKLMKNKVVRE